jgi:hypothetical protein
MTSSLLLGHATVTLRNPPIRKTMRGSLSSNRLRRSSTTVACSLAPQSLCTTLATYRTSGETTLCPKRSLHSTRWQPGKTDSTIANPTNTTEAPTEEGLIIDARHCIATCGCVGVQGGESPRETTGAPLIRDFRMSGRKDAGTGFLHPHNERRVVWGTRGSIRFEHLPGLEHRETRGTRLRKLAGLN